MIENFNHALMELAREAAGLSQEALADGIGCTQATISRWDHGLFRPSEKELSDLARELKVPPSFFSRDDSLLGGGLPVFYHRALAAAPARVTATVNARCFMRAMHIATLWKMSPTGEHDFPVLHSDRFKGGATDVAASLRAYWSIPHGPVHNLVGLLESKGGIVIIEDLGCDDVDALCWWRAGLPKLFFVNARKPACRMRFSLAHELGHTVMHTEPTDTAQAEREADQFAGDFLMPRKEARAVLAPPLKLARLAALKPWWKMSMAAMAKHAKECGIITADELSSFMREMGLRGMRKREPVDIAAERPTRFGKMLRHPLDSLGWGLNELASALFVGVEELQKMLDNNLVLPQSESLSSTTLLRLVR